MFSPTLDLKGGIEKGGTMTAFSFTYDISRPLDPKRHHSGSLKPTLAAYVV